MKHPQYIDPVCGIEFFLTSQNIDPVCGIYDHECQSSPQYIYIDKVEQQVEFAMEYFASFGTALVPTMGLHKAVLHVLAKRYAIYPKARQNNDTLAISFKTYFRPKKMYQFEKKKH